MAIVRAKFKVDEIVLRSYGEVIKMSAVQYDDDDENKTFNKFTPNGSFSMDVTNEKVHGIFKPDQEYYLDFTPVK